jgi:hypothetical protein
MRRMGAPQARAVWAALPAALAQAWGEQSHALSMRGAAAQEGSDSEAARGWGARLFGLRA